jgi:ATP-dependent protease ClpP protease subunit
MAVLVNGELVLYGFVGASLWDEGFTARDVIDALAEVGRDTDIVVRVNSGGGYVDDGIAIHNSLQAHKGKVTVVIDALAASSASIIAMAGDERIMRKGAMMMIHDPSTVVWGTAEDMTSAVKMLEKHAENLAGIYADVTGEDPDDIRADMKSELWLNAEEAVERGFATSANSKPARAAASHDYSVYAKAPERLVALATKKNWSHAEAGTRAVASATASTRQARKETPMPTDTKADENAANASVLAEATKKATAEAQARIKAIMTSEEAKGRETLASHFAYDTESTADAAIAAMKASPKASATTETNAGGYEKQRLDAANLAQPQNNSGANGNGNKPTWGEAIKSANVGKK